MVIGIIFDELLNVICDTVICRKKEKKNFRTNSALVATKKLTSEDLGRPVALASSFPHFKKHWGLFTCDHAAGLNIVLIINITVSHVSSNFFSN